MPLLSTMGASSGRGFGLQSGGTLIIAGPLSFNIPGGMNVDLRTKALEAGWDGSSAITATITANIGSASTAASLNISGSFPTQPTVIINPGVYVVGRGGDWGSNGGAAIAVSSAVNINNQGVIGGGGGGGAAAGGGGGGAGLPGGVGYANGTLTTGGVSITGRAGGAPGSAGSSPGTVPSLQEAYGGGGGLGGAGGRYRYNEGGDTTAALLVGDVGSDGERLYYTENGGVAGPAVSTGNSLITWVAPGTRYGALNG